MNRAHRIRLNPTPEQAGYFARAAGTARFAFNWGRAEWERLYAAGEKPSAFSLKAAFNAVKVESFPWVREVTKCATEGAFADLGVAFANFFRDCKKSKGRKSAYPKFKAKRRTKPAFYLANDKFWVDGHELKVPHVGIVNMTESLMFVGKILSGRISFKAGYWWVSIQVELPEPVKQVHAGPPVGIDLGLKELAVCSDGTRLPNPRHLNRGLARIRGLSRLLSRKVNGSSNWLKTKAKLARAQYRISCQRSDGIHKLTRWLADNFSLIGLESLNVAGMVRNHCLARAVIDASFGELARQSIYKSEPVGGRVIQVDRWFPSTQIHHGCGHRQAGLTLADRAWICGGCGVGPIDRDLNASLNIRDEAIRMVGTG